MSNILSGVRDTFDPRPSTSAVVPIPVPEDAGHRTEPSPVIGSIAGVTPPQPLQMSSQNTQHQFPQLPGMFSNTSITGGVFHFTFNVAGSSSSSNSASPVDPAVKRRKSYVVYSDSDSD